MSVGDEGKTPDDPTTADSFSDMPGSCKVGASMSMLGDPGEGTSVGTGNSVGEEAGGADDPMIAEIISGRSSCVSTSAVATSPEYGDPGDGMSVGTGISVGDTITETDKTGWACQSADRLEDG